MLTRIIKNYTNSIQNSIPNPTQPNQFNAVSLVRFQQRKTIPSSFKHSISNDAGHNQPIKLLSIISNERLTKPTLPNNQKLHRFPPCISPNLGYRNLELQNPKHNLQLRSKVRRYSIHSTITHRAYEGRQTEFVNAQKYIQEDFR